ncbi:MAG: patatin family protein [Ruminococcaceae bacterium]|nr:patatin family protein [Oscillospiraceae bacterium]
MKKGLVLEGGAMRGLFSAGVTDVMMENGIRFDGLIGVSAGAVFGCNYKSVQPGRALRYNTKYCNHPKYCSFRSLIKTGDLYGADFCYRELPQKLDLFDTDTFNQNPMEFHLVCTDVTTGKAVYHQCETADDECLEWFRASASMPMVSRIVEVGGHKLLDGGIADSIPLRYFEGLGYKKNVVVLTQPKDYIKKKNRMMPLIRLAMRQYPEMIRAMADRHVHYNETVRYINKQEAAGRIFVIRPEAPLPVGHIEHNPDKLKETHEIGRQVALARLDALRSFLSAD